MKPLVLDWILLIHLPQLLDAESRERKSNLYCICFSVLGQGAGLCHRLLYEIVRNLGKSHIDRIDFICE